MYGTNDKQLQPRISEIIFSRSISRVFDMSMYLYVIYNSAGFGAPYSFIHIYFIKILKQCDKLFFDSNAHSLFNVICCKDLTFT